MLSCCSLVEAAPAPGEELQGEVHPDGGPGDQARGGRQGVGCGPVHFVELRKGKVQLSSLKSQN